MLDVGGGGGGVSGGGGLTQYIHPCVDLLRLLKKECEFCCCWRGARVVTRSLTNLAPVEQVTLGNMTLLQRRVARLEEEKLFRQKERSRLFGVLDALWERTRALHEEASAFKEGHKALTLTTLEKIEVRVRSSNSEQLEQVLAISLRVKASKENRGHGKNCLPDSVAGMENI